MILSLIGQRIQDPKIQGSDHGKIKSKRQFWKFMSLCLRSVPQFPAIISSPLIPRYDIWPGSCCLTPFPHHGAAMVKANNGWQLQGWFFWKYYQLGLQWPFSPGPTFCSFYVRIETDNTRCESFYSNFLVCRGWNRWTVAFTWTGIFHYHHGYRGIQWNNYRTFRCYDNDNLPAMRTAGTHAKIRNQNF